MGDDDRHDAWSAGQSYDEYMGRWSRAIADSFLEWLDVPAGLAWLDVGCGTGALTSAVLARCAPSLIIGVDPSDGFVEHARSAIADPRASFEVGAAESVPLDTGSVDVVTSALAYNFVPDRPAALAELRRVTRPAGTISLYVWDYPSGGVGFIDAFWKAAAALDPSAADLDEAGRFHFCTSDALAAELSAAGLSDITVVPVEVVTRFVDFEAFWHPFTLGAGPAPGYLADLDGDARHALRQRLQDEFENGPIEFTARAWAACARR